MGTHRSCDVFGSDSVSLSRKGQTLLPVRTAPSSLEPFTHPCANVMREAIERDAQQVHLGTRTTIGPGIPFLSNLVESGLSRFPARLLTRRHFHLNDKGMPGRLQHNVDTAARGAHFSLRINADESHDGHHDTLVRLLAETVGQVIASIKPSTSPDPTARWQAMAQPLVCETSVSERT